MKNYRLAPLVLCLSTLPAAFAQDSSAGDSEAEPPQYYQVELIVFRHLDQSRTTGEIPRMPEPEMADLLDQDLARLQEESESVIVLTDSTVAEPDSNEAEEEPAFIPARAEMLLLADTAERLAKLQVYEVVSYITWGQTAPDVTVAESLELTALGADPERLSGTIELHQRRYLHLALEIALDDGGAGSSISGDSQFIPRGAAAVPAIKDSRRIRLEEIQYFDQPEFGVLAVVSRMPANEAPAGAG